MFLLLIGVSLAVALPVLLNRTTHQVQATKNAFIIPGIENKIFKNKAQAEEFLNRTIQSENEFEFKDQTHAPFHDKHRGVVEKQWKSKHIITPVEGEQITKTTDLKDFKQSAIGKTYFVFNKKVYLTKQAAINAWLKANPIKVQGRGDKTGNTYTQAQIDARDATGNFPVDPSKAAVGLNAMPGSGTGDKSGNTYTQAQIDHAKGGNFVAPNGAEPGVNTKGTPATFSTKLFSIRNPINNVPTNLSVNPYDTKFNSLPGQTLAQPGTDSKYVFVNAWSKIAFSGFKWLDKQNKIKEEINKLPGFDEKKWANFVMPYEERQDPGTQEKYFRRKNEYNRRFNGRGNYDDTKQEKSTIYATYFTAKDNPALKYDGWYLYFDNSVISDADQILNKKGLVDPDHDRDVISAELKQIRNKIPLQITKKNINKFYRVNLGNSITPANDPFPKQKNIIMAPGTAEFKRMMNFNTKMSESDVYLYDQVSLYSGDVGAWQEIYNALLTLGNEKKIGDVSIYDIKKTSGNTQGRITPKEIQNKLSKKYKPVIEDLFGTPSWVDFAANAAKINSQDFLGFTFFGGRFNTVLETKEIKGYGDESGNDYSQAQIDARDATGNFPVDPSKAAVGLNAMPGSGTGDKSGNTYTQAQIDHEKGGNFVAPAGALVGLNSHDIPNAKADGEKTIDIILKHANSIPPQLTDGTPENQANIKNSAFHYLRYGKKVYLDKKTAEKAQEEDMKKAIHLKHIFYLINSEGQKVIIKGDTKPEAILNALKNIKSK